MALEQAWLITCVLLLWALIEGCANFGHYSVNEPLNEYEQGYGYIAENKITSDNSEELLLILSFSGGGIRADAFSYGVLEELGATQVTLDGWRRSLLNEVDIISGVSGGSFPAAYYGLFGNRIFEEFENRLLKKNIRGAITAGLISNPINWFRLSSPFFNRSHSAAEYYDQHIFDKKNFGDLLKNKGSMTLINVTNMSKGTRLSFSQRAFDTLCSDLSKFPMVRACAASSTVPGVMLPITLKNYAGRRGYVLPSLFGKSLHSYRQREIRENLYKIIKRRANKNEEVHCITHGYHAVGKLCHSSSQNRISGRILSEIRARTEKWSQIALGKAGSRLS